MTRPSVRSVLSVDDDRLFWAVDADRVRSVTRDADWRGDAAPLDIAARLGTDDGPGGAARVVVVQGPTGDGPIAVLARGPVSLSELPADEVHPIPDLVRRAGCPPLLAAVHLPPDGARPLFLIEPQFAASTEATPAPSAPRSIDP
ncbi:MAG: hypothetical protein ACOCV4_04565 [Myxococcota bacterium]